MIRLYYMKLDGDCSKEQSLALYEMLPQERKESVDRAKNKEIAKKRLYTGAFLQYILSKETGVLAEQLHYRYNEWGKPELDVERMVQEIDCKCNRFEISSLENIHFNLSHSGDYVVLAVSDSLVGVDIEHKMKSYESLAKRCFHEAEYKDIMSAEAEWERQHRFLVYWTMKEAYIKYVGEGMRIPLNSFQIERNEEGLSFVKGMDVYFKTLFQDGIYCISVCGSSLDGVEKCVKQREQVTEILK